MEPALCCNLPTNKKTWSKMQVVVRSAAASSNAACQHAMRRRWSCVQCMYWAMIAAASGLSGVWLRVPLAALLYKSQQIATRPCPPL